MDLVRFSIPVLLRFSPAVQTAENLVPGLECSGVSMLTFVASSTAATLMSASLLMSRIPELCSVDMFESAIEPGSTYLLTVAHQDSMAVAAEGVRSIMDIPYVPGRELFERTPVPESEWTWIFGQVVDVERFHGDGAALLEGGSFKAIVVPWYLGNHCEAERWRRSALWIPVGTRGILKARLRPKDFWVGGLPVFDVLTASEQPYPIGRYSLLDLGHDGSRKPWLTVDQYWTLIEVLPTWTDLSDTPDSALGQLTSWAERNRALASRFPAIKILRHGKHLRDMYVQRRKVRALQHVFSIIRGKLF
jgi:hypothetical protein